MLPGAEEGRLSRYKDFGLSMSSLFEVPQMIAFEFAIPNMRHRSAKPPTPCSRHINPE
jgi:hypothetical protein